MQINVTARTEDVTNSMREYAEEKAQKLDKYYGQIHSLDVILDKEHDDFFAEIKVTAGRGGKPLVSKTTDKDMAAAIDFVVDKMERQLTKLKEKTRSHKAVATGEAVQAEPAAGPTEPEETYEDVIRSKEF